MHEEKGESDDFRQNCRDSKVRLKELEKSGKTERLKLRKVRKMNSKGYYGAFGGQFVAESLMNALQELERVFEEAICDEYFM